MKKCKLCGKEKSFGEFYINSGYKDGFSCRCKSCVADKAKESESKKSIEQIRERHRDKYKRLNYKERQKVWDENKSWKSTAKYKNLHRNFKIEKGMEIHHWSYNDEHLEDFIVLTASIHKGVHKFLVLDINNKMFRTLTGELLDTKQKHIDYLNSKNFNI